MSILRCGVCVLLVLTLLGCAARKHMKQADAAALAGRPAEAAQQYELALAAKPELGQDPEFIAKLRRARAEAHYEKGMSLQRDHSYAAAEEAYRKAIEADATFEPPTGALRNLGPAAATWHMKQATLRRDAGDLDAAIDLLQSAVQWDNTNAAAAAQLQSTIDLRAKRRAEADRLLAAANAAASRDAWDEALRQTEAAAALLPMDQTLKSRVAQVKSDATDHYLAAAAARRNAGQFDAADQALVQAAAYGQGDDRVQRALSDVDIARAEAAKQGGYLGAAYQHYTAAAAHLPGSADRRAAEARAAVLRQHAIAVNITADDAELAAATRARLDRKAGDLFSSANAHGAMVTLSILHFDIDQQHVGSRSASHTHTVMETAPNPRIPALTAELDATRHDLHNLRRRFAISCRHCGGRGYGIHPETHAHIHCDRCRRTGRLHWRITESQIRSLDRQADRLHRQLLHEPPTVQVPVQAAWPYTVHTYRKTGDVRAQVKVDGRAPVVVKRSYNHTDTSIDDANPTIGLPANPLEMPTDAQVRDILITGAGYDAGNHIMKTLGAARAAELDRGDTEQRIAARLIRETIE